VKLLLLIAGRPETAKQIRRMLHSDYSILTATSEESALEFARSVLVDVVLMDFNPPYQKMQELLSRMEQLQRDAPIIALIPQEMSERDREEYSERVYNYVQKPLSLTDLVHAVRRALERRRLLQETRLMRAQADRASATLIPERVLAPTVQVHERTLREFSKALAASFDIQKLVNLFLDTISEMFRVSKVSVLLLDRTHDQYRIEVSRGLHPGLTTNLRFSSNEGIPEWLRQQGRILRLEEVSDRRSEPAALEVKRELEILHASVSVPLATKGTLIGILNLGEKVTGAQFTNEELETLFTLASHVAVAVEDISLYHEIKYQKEFTESILQKTDNGLITVNEMEKVTVFNPKAEEILEQKAQEVLGRDLRILPSPLGDMLYETMRTGKDYEKFEVEIKSPKLPLQVSTRQLVGPNGTPVGSLMLVTDLRLRRDLEAEKAKAERLDVVNKVVAGIAHEIKNPLSSMTTHTQLLREKYDDPEFREFFRSTVTGDLGRVNDVVEKFVQWTQPSKRELSLQDIHLILDEALSSLKNGRIPENIRVSTRYHASLPEIKGDPKELAKGFSSIIYNSVEAMPDGGNLTISTLSDSQYVKVSISDTGAGIPPEQLEEIWDPLFSTKNRGIGLGLPIARKIIEGHGGKIEVRSEPEKGSTFQVFLPIP